MAKECFGLKKVDAVKFRECASCQAFEPCTRSIYLKEAFVADKVGMGLGFALGAFGLVWAVINLSEMPVGSPWRIVGSVVYLLSVYYASREYSRRNEQETAEAVANSDGVSAKAAPAPAHH